jgi:hypothetical protein
VLFLLFFIAYWAGMFVVCGIAFREGEWHSNQSFRGPETLTYLLAVNKSCRLSQGLASKAVLHASTWRDMWISCSTLVPIQGCYQDSKPCYCRSKGFLLQCKLQILV